MQNANGSVEVERFVASLTAESEFFGLLGSGHPDSFYKVYVRRTKDSRRGWCFEVDAAVVDPCERTGLDRTSRHPRATAPDRSTRRPAAAGQNYAPEDRRSDAEIAASHTNRAAKGERASSESCAEVSRHEKSSPT